MGAHVPNAFLNESPPNSPYFPPIRLNPLRIAFMPLFLNLNPSIFSFSPFLKLFSSNLLLITAFTPLEKLLS
jgi:hypothetical protein